MIGVLVGVLLTGCSLQSGALLGDATVADADGGRAETGMPPVDSAPPDSDRPDSGVGDTGPPDTAMTMDGAADSSRDTGPSCVPAEEVCNALDDDCDLEIDEEGCGCERELHGGHVYLFCTGGRSFADSTADCASWGYHLIFIDDAEEQTFAWDAASRRIAGDWWIGLSDLEMEDRYQWLDGTVVWEGGAPLRYHAFRGGAPDDTSTEDCFEMDAAGGVWAGATCSQGQPYVCESP